MGTVSQTATRKEAATDDSKFTGAISRTTCPKELEDRLKALSDDTGAPQTYHVRKAVEEYLDRKGVIT